jgi:hypothetical protein
MIGRNGDDDLGHGSRMVPDRCGSRDQTPLVATGQLPTPNGSFYADISGFVGSSACNSGRSPVKFGFPYHGNAKPTATKRVYLFGTPSPHRFAGGVHARFENCCFEALQNCHMYKVRAHEKNLIPIRLHRQEKAENG